MKEFSSTIQWRDLKPQEEQDQDEIAALFSEAKLTAPVLRILAQALDALKTLGIDTILLAKVGGEEVFRETSGTQDIEPLVREFEQFEKMIDVELWLEHETVYLLWVIHCQIYERVGRQMVSFGLDLKAVIQQPFRSATRNEYLPKLQEEIGSWIRSGEDQSETITQEIISGLNEAFDQEGAREEYRPEMTVPKQSPTELRQQATTAPARFTRRKIYPRSYENEIGSHQPVGFFDNWLLWAILANSSEMSECVYRKEDGEELTEEVMQGFFKASHDLAGDAESMVPLGGTGGGEDESREGRRDVESEDWGDSDNFDDDDRYDGSDDKYDGGTAEHHGQDDDDDKYDGGPEEGQIDEDDDDEPDDEDDDDGDDGDDGGDD